jgi:hypothetical protein
LRKTAAKLHKQQVKGTRTTTKGKEKEKRARLRSLVDRRRVLRSNLLLFVAVKRLRCRTSLPKSDLFVWDLARLLNERARSAEGACEVGEGEVGEGKLADLRAATALPPHVSENRRSADAERIRNAPINTSSTTFPLIAYRCLVCILAKHCNAIWPMPAIWGERE